MEFDVTTFAWKDGGRGPLEALGQAIDVVEGTDGILKLDVARSGENERIEVKLSQHGPQEDKQVPRPTDSPDADPQP